MRRILLLPALLATAACSEGSRPEASASAAHTSKDFIIDNSPFLWSQGGEDERARMEQDNSWKAVPVSASPLVERMQGWLDRFDAVTRASVRAKTGRDLVAPKPQVLLVVDGSMNASVHRRPTLLAGTPVDPTLGIVDDMQLLSPSKAVGLSPFAVPRTGLARGRSAESGIAWFNQLGGLTLRQNGERLEAVGHEGVVRSARSAFVAAASPNIVVHTGLVRATTERATAAILAHELGHYYRAHGTTGNPSYDASERYGFWYDRDAPSPDRPTPAPNQDAYNELFAAQRGSAIKVEGQKLEPFTASALVAWAEYATVIPGEPCEGAIQAVQAWRYDTSGRLRRAEATDADRTLYNEFEDAVVACAPNMQLDADARTRVTNIGRTGGFAEAWKNAAAKATTLSELIARSAAAAVTMSQNMANIERRQAGNHLGFYTDEQEADEISIELLTAVGLAPEDAITSMFEMVARARPAGAASGVLEGPACRTAYERGFKNPDGTDIFVSMGDLNDPHHVPCYRIFNVTREVAAHRYRIAEPAFVDDVATWTQLQKLAETIETSQ